MKSKHVYSLPFEKNNPYIAISDEEAHFGRGKHAVDFAIDFNVPIIAPLDGIIWNVKDDATEGGDEEKYTAWEYQNLITIKHADNEYSQYVHLAHKSAKVKIGDKVTKGQVIATGIDMIGCTTTPHVHMMVFDVLDEEKNEWESKEIQFEEEIDIIRDDKKHEEALQKPENKKLKELEEQYHQ